MKENFGKVKFLKERYWFKLMNKTLGILVYNANIEQDIANCLDENIKEMLNDSYDTSYIKLNDTFLIDSFWNT